MRKSESRDLRNGAKRHTEHFNVNAWRVTQSSSTASNPSRLHVVPQHKLLKAVPIKS